MGNRIASPTALVSYDTAAAELGREDVERLSVAYRELRGKSVMLEKPRFIEHTANELGLLGRITASRLFDLLDADNSKVVTFEQYVVGVYVFSHSTPEERARLIFSMFDRAHKGYLDAQCLGEALEIVTVESELSGRGASKAMPEDALQNRPYQPLVSIMVATTLRKFDKDADGKLSPSEWLMFSQYEENVQKFEKRLTAVLTKSLVRPPLTKGEDTHLGDTVYSQEKSL